MPAPTIPTQQLAHLLDVDASYIRKLTARGILNRAQDEDGNEIKGRYTLLAIRDYCRWLRSQLRLDDSSEVLRNQLKNRKTAAEAEMAELHLQEYKSELHRSRDVEFVMTNMLTHFKARVLSIPARIARLLVGKTKFQEIYDTIMTEIELALRELAAYDRTMFAEQTRAFMASQGFGERDGDGNDERGDSVKEV